MDIHQDAVSDVNPSLRILAVALSFGLATAAGNWFNPDAGRVLVFWPCNGMLVAYLLTRPAREWSKSLAGALLANFAAQSFFTGEPLDALLLALCNLVEVGVASVLVRRALRRHRYLASRGMILEVLLNAIILAPLAGISVAAVSMEWVHRVSLRQTFHARFPADAVGMALMVPVTLAVMHQDGRRLVHKNKLNKTLGVFFLVFVFTCLVFGQVHYFLLFLLFPVLMIVLFEAGAVAAFLVLTEIFIVGAQFTTHSRGPFWLPKGATFDGSILRLQVYVFGIMISLIPVAIIRESQRQLRSSLREGLKRYRLLADNSRDIVLLSNLEGRRLYVSPAVTDLLGWLPEEWNNQTSTDLMHPCDVAPFRRMLNEMLHGHDRRTFCYRTRHKNGNYVHMEASVRVLLDEVSGQPTAFVANVRDVSQRVDAERKLSLAYEQMQEQAQRDGLTGLANRRRFDEALDAEWRRGRRTGRNLALIMVDVDNFKRLNDSFGHRAGDCCLQAIAACLRMTTRRPSDVVARYGGEEFAMLLPDVEIATALVMAEALCMKVGEQRIDAGVGRDLTLTVSVGVAAQIPDTNFRADVLVEAADRALYAAKQAGRNCVVTGTAMEEPASTPYHVH
ncbi:MAG TPA: diguanylate cyclase [Acidobacteriaceae bacterium]|nr:diguanylate cyclase [Acidobacteriaceae bacterium]